jgi:hypothetical protein
MNKYNGWYNKMTWHINVSYMGAMEDMVKAGGTSDIKWYIQNQLTKGLSKDQRDIMWCAFELIDWDVLIERATENVEKEKVA